MSESRMHPGVQFALGVLIGSGTYGLIMVLAALGVPMGIGSWIGVFAVIWVTTFIALRKKMFALMVGFVLTVLTAYMFLAARGFRL